MSQEPDDDRLDVFNTLSHRVSSRLSVEQVVDPGREMAATYAASNLAILTGIGTRSTPPGCFKGDESDEKKRRDKRAS
jgi:hypothetical protein